MDSTTMVHDLGSRVLAAILLSFVCTFLMMGRIRRSVAEAIDEPAKYLARMKRVRNATFAYHSVRLALAAVGLVVANECVAYLIRSSVSD
jgi:hypothetical protein